MRLDYQILVKSRPPLLTLLAGSPLY